MEILKQIQAVWKIRRFIKSYIKSKHMDSKAILLIQFPTRERPEKFLMVAQKYINLLKDKQNWMMNVSCDTDDFSMNNTKMINAVYSLAEEGHIFLNFNDNVNKIQAVNANVNDFEYDIILLASDDMIPKEPNYDETIREYYRKFFPNYDGVLHFNDGYQADRLNTLSILGKAYYNRFGYIYNPIYQSFYADDEFDNVSRRIGKRKYFDQCIIKHEHPNFGFVPNDALYIKNNAPMEHDKSIYQQRLANNFGLPTR